MSKIAVELDYEHWVWISAALLMSKIPDYEELQYEVRAQVSANPKGYPGAKSSDA